MKKINEFPFNKIYSKEDDYLIYDITKPLDDNRIGIAFGGGNIDSPLFIAIIDFFNNNIIQTFQINQENADHGELLSLHISKRGNVIMGHFLDGVVKIWMDFNFIY